MSARTLGGEGLKVLSLGELLRYPFKPREHLLAPWLRQGESVLLWAKTGLGKSWLALSMGLAVAGGGEFLGWRSDTPRRVLVVDGEMHTEDLKDRLAILIPAIDGIDPAAAADNMALLPRQFQNGNVSFPDIATPEGQDVILKKIADHCAELVILDNFSTLAEVADENEAAAMTPVLSFLLRLKQHDVAAVLVHHSGKSGQTYRGSSKLATTFEVILGLLPYDGAQAGGGAGFNTEWSKYRGAPNPSTRPALVILKDRGEGRGVQWTAQASEDDDVSRMIAEVQTLKHTRDKDLAEALGWTQSKLSKTKAKALRDGRVGRDEIATFYGDARAAEMDGPLAPF